jgi:hypothetical protein
MFSALAGLTLVAAMPTTTDRSDDAWTQFGHQCAVKFYANSKLMVKLSIHEGDATIIDESKRYERYSRAIRENGGYSEKGAPIPYGFELLADDIVAALEGHWEDSRSESKKRYTEFNADLDECRKAYPEDQVVHGTAPDDHRPECAANYQALAQVIMRSTNAARNLESSERARRVGLWSQYSLRAVQMTQPGANLTQKLPAYIQTAADGLADKAMEEDSGLRHVTGAVNACDAEFNLATIPL